MRKICLESKSEVQPVASSLSVPVLGTNTCLGRHLSHLLLPPLVQYYVPGWDLTFSMNFRHSALECTLIPQFLHPTRATFSSASSHHLNFAITSSSLSISPCFSTKDFLCRITYFHPLTCSAHLNPPSLTNSTSSCTVATRVHLKCLRTNPLRDFRLPPRSR